jgi:GT2 family glycosyltransferase
MQPFAARDLHADPPCDQHRHEFTQDTTAASIGSHTTVVIATRNRCAEVLRTLRQLALLAPAPPIIVVDNASEDGTACAVRQAAAWVRVIPLRRNWGAVARNLGVYCARTPYVAFSDDDSWWAPGALSRAEWAFDHYPRLGLIAARMVVGPDERTDPVSASMAESPLGRADGLPWPSVLGFTACSAVVRRQAFIAVGGFNTLLFFTCEEELLAFDLAAAGWALAYVDKIVAHHHPSPHRPAPAHRRQLQWRNSTLVAWMRRPPGVAIAAARTLAQAARTDAIARRALFGALRRLPAALAQRRALPAEVEREITVLEEARGT